MKPCPRCNGTRVVVPAMSAETLAAFNAVGGCLDREPCPVCSSLAGAVSLADAHGGSLSFPVDTRLEIPRA